MEPRGLKVLREQPVHKAYKETPELQVQQGRKVHKVYKAQLGPQEMTERTALQELLARQEVQDPQA
jgi:hypothetical protein